MYCDLGLKSARIAEVMQRAGYEAYGFLGGIRALKRLADERSRAESVSVEKQQAGNR